MALPTQMERQPVAIDATDITFATGSGGLGLGQPFDTGSPAPGTDIQPGFLSGGKGIPAFNTGSNLGASPLGTNFNGPNTTAPQSSAGASDPSPALGGSTNPGISDALSASIPGSVQNYFTRALVIITGMIFLAIGLNMLRPGTVPVPGRVAP